MKLNEIRRELKKKRGDPEEADRILCRVYGIEKTELYLRLFDDFGYSDEIDGIAARRTNGEPLEYIIGKAAFCGLEFIVSPDCLIPQADTEIVVRAALENLSGGRFLDLCTGSGCIAVSLSKLGGGHGTAVDVSASALDIAKKNAALYGVADKINFVCADVFGSAEEYADGKFDLIVSNPPYIKSDVIDTLSREVLCEPRIALNGGDDGLDFYRRLIPLASSLLCDGGTLVLEIGYDEAEDVGALLRDGGFEYEILKDFGANDRCVMARRSIIPEEK